ncbi:MAG: hypothetical protein Kow00124_07870 [Anaerolineae bacterium]
MDLKATMRSVLWLLSLAAVLALAACDGSPPAEVLPAPAASLSPEPPSLPTMTPLPPPTVTPFPTATPDGSSLPPAAEEGGETGQVTVLPAPNAGPPSDLELGNVIFRSDFSVGWPTLDQGTIKIGLDGGQYVFEVGPFDGGFITTTAVNQADLYASVEVLPVECPPRGGYGLLFRYNDAGSYYAFTVYCDNTFAVTGRVGGALVGLGVEPGTLPAGLDASSAVVHTVAVLTRGGEFTLYLDGQVVARFTDERLGTGDIALYAASQSGSPARISFDNLEVRAIR